MISIIDYGLGNVLAFANIYQRLNIDYRIVSNKDQLKNSKKIILPGVGSFDWAINSLDKSGMRNTLDELVLENKIPVLGICVGMQIMAMHSEEGESEGLGWINEEVIKFNTDHEKDTTCLPHMGWNNVKPIKKNNLFTDLEADPLFYFLHSYCFPKKTESVIAKTEYNQVFASAIKYENIYGVQFHPEKSHQWGVQLLQNFSEHC